MTISGEELKQRYDALSDQELLDIWNKNTLTETAQAILKTELLQ